MADLILAEVSGNPAWRRLVIERMNSTRRDVGERRVLSKVVAASAFSPRAPSREARVRKQMEMQRRHVFDLAHRVDQEFPSRPRPPTQTKSGWHLSGARRSDRSRVPSPLEKRGFAKSALLAASRAPGK